MKKLLMGIIFAALPILSGCRPESAFKVSLRLEDETTGKPIADAWVITVAEVDYAPLREEPYNKAVAAARGITGKNGKLRLKKVEGTYFGEEPKDQLWLMLESRKPPVDREITAIRGGSIFVFSNDHGFLHQPFAVTETDPEYRGWYGGNETSWNRKTIKLDIEAIKKNQPLVLKWKVPDDPKMVKGAFQTEFLAFMMSGMTEKTGATVKEKEALYNFFVRNMEEATRTSDDPFFRREYEKLKDPETQKEVLNWQFAKTENHDTTVHEWLTQKALELLEPEYEEVKQYAEAVKQGIIDEDDNVRAVHHFYNPDKPGSGMLSKDNALKWGAIGCPGNPNNEWDLEDAARYYRAGDKEKAYKALGHVIHLLEDLSAPMHTRMIVHDKVFHGEAARFETYFSELIKKQANSLPPEYWQTADTIKPATDIKQLFENTAKLTFGSFTREGQTVNFNDYYAPNKFIKNPDNQTLELMGRYLFPKTIKASAALMSWFHATLHPDLSAQKPSGTATDAGQSTASERNDKATKNTTLFRNLEGLSPLERYKRTVDKDIKSRKIDLKPVKQVDGIKTGLVIAYGHVVQPPYNVYVGGKGIMINGVQISPSLIWEREVTQKASPHHPPSPTEPETLNRELEVARAAVKIFQEGKYRKSDMERYNDAITYLLASTDVVKNIRLKNSFKEGDIIHVCWKRFEHCIGAIKLYDEDRVKQQHTREANLPVKDMQPQTPEDRQKNALETSIKSIQNRLNMGFTLIFTSHGEGQKRTDIRKEVTRIMNNGHLNEETKIDELKKIGFGYSGALDIIENYHLEEWEIEQ